MSFAYSSILLFDLLLVAAALDDMKRLQVSNLLPLAVVACFGLHLLLNGATWHIWQNLAGFTAVLLVGGLLFAKRVIGGGDAKLLAAIALWFDFHGLAIWLPAVGIIGGLTAIILYVVRGMLPVHAVADGGWIGLQRRGPIPYAVPICVAAIATAHLVGTSPRAGESIEPDVHFTSPLAIRRL
jgi:prepilin peptidase CpaA